MATSPPIRATLDPDVTKAWNAALAAYRKRFGWLHVVGGVGMVVGLAGQWLAGKWMLLAVIPGMGAFVAAAVTARTAAPKCPHCGELPYPPFQRGVDPYSVEWCAHCLYWLRKPW